MFVIIEWNGVGRKSILGLVLEEDGIAKVFDTEQEALNWAKENCAFEWRVVGLF